MTEFLEQYRTHLEYPGSAFMILNFKKEKASGGKKF